jgi:hypothetical protein
LSERHTIDAVELVSVRMSEDSTKLCLQLFDEQGNKFQITLPTGCLNRIVAASPRIRGTDTPSTLDDWSMQLAENGRDVLLTLRGPDGASVSFNAKPWQVEGMATIASHGYKGRRSSKLLN